jgi:hypothetical protein
MRSVLRDPTIQPHQASRSQERGPGKWRTVDMRRPNLPFVAAGRLLVLPALLIALAPAVSSTRAAPPGAIAVSETNIDGNGLIRTHEQGVANTRVTNLPTNAAGDVRVSGTVDIGKTVNVNVANIPEVAIANTPTMAIKEPVQVFLEPATTLMYAALDAVPSGTATASWGNEAPVVTSVSFWASSDAHFQLTGDGAFSFHVKAGTNVVHSFATPLAASHMRVECPGGCNVSVSIVGHE